MCENCEEKKLEQTSAEETIKQETCNGECQEQECTCEENDLNKQFEELKAEAEKYRNAAVNIKADFENYKDFVEREKKMVENRTRESLLKNFFKVYEKLALSLKYKETAEFPKAMEMVARDFAASFENSGMKFIAPNKGDQFDPFEHEVVDKIETDEVKEYHVFDMTSIGYKINNNVITAAKVVVAVKPKPQPVEEKPAEETVTAAEETSQQAEQ